MSTEDHSEASVTPKSEYSALISEAGLSVLRGMIGNRFHTILSPCLQVDGAHLTAPSFSILVFDKVTRNWAEQYIVVRCKWYETPLVFSDYWQILVSCEDRPDQIDVDSAGAVVAPCTINFYLATPITKIEVYEFEWSDEVDLGRETVRYDKAIRFEQESGKTFCIACQLNGPGIATDVHISEDAATISQFLHGSRLRVCLT